MTVTLFNVILLIDVLIRNNLLSVASSISVSGFDFVRLKELENLILW